MEPTTGLPDFLHASTTDVVAMVERSRALSDHRSASSDIARGVTRFEALQQQVLQRPDEDHFAPFGVRRVLAKAAASMDASLLAVVALHYDLDTSRLDRIVQDFRAWADDHDDVPIAHRNPLDVDRTLPLSTNDFLVVDLAMRVAAWTADASEGLYADTVIGRVDQHRALQWFREADRARIDARAKLAARVAAHEIDRRATRTRTHGGATSRDQRTTSTRLRAPQPWYRRTRVRIAAAVVFVAGGIGTALRMGSTAGSPEDVTAAANTRRSPTTTIVLDDARVDTTTTINEPRQDAATPPAPEPTPAATPIPISAWPATHTVSRGESLTEIARNDLTLRLGHAPTPAETGVALQLWSDANPIGDVDLILVGQELIRPPVEAFTPLTAPAPAPAIDSTPEASNPAPEAAPITELAPSAETTTSSVTVSSGDPQLDTLGEIVTMDLIFRLGTRPTNGQLARAIRLWANVNDIDDPNLVFNGQTLHPPTAEQLRWAGIVGPTVAAAPTDLGISR